MTLSRLAAPALLVASIAVAGCYTPQPTTLYRQDKALSDEEVLEMARCWSDWGRSNSDVWKSLSDNRRARLNQVWTKAHSEMLRDGKMSPETKQMVINETDQLNTELIVSFDAIASNPTPDMNGQLESWDRRRQNDSMVYNQNLRALADEWSRVWLMEKPGGTPYDTVNTTGRF
jgi:hypothetical protein